MTIVLRTALSIQTALSPFHPVLVEGHSRDVRDPHTVANRIVSNLRRHWGGRSRRDDEGEDEDNVGNVLVAIKPPLLIIQGDPLTERGISAITRIVADELGIERCLVCLDEDIDPDHSALADREGVGCEIRYSRLVEILEGDAGSRMFGGSASARLTRAIDDEIAAKNVRRSAMGMDDLADWYRRYALLQGERYSLFRFLIGCGALLGAIHLFCIHSCVCIGCKLVYVRATTPRSYQGGNESHLWRGYGGSHD